MKTIVVAVRQPPSWAWANSIHPKMGTATTLSKVSALGTLMLLGRSFFVAIGSVCRVTMPHATHHPGKDSD
ncbi:hypothetical protein PA05_2302 [Cutibacterium acnes P05]|nr:hypothetical protein [Cutibacterium acnes P05]